MPVSDAIKGIGGLSSATETLSVVRVVDIILDETHPEFINLGGWDSLGTIFYIGVNDQKNKLGNVSDDNNLKAKPLFPNLKQYPLKNELVLVCTAIGKNIYNIKNPQQRYYLPPLNIWNHQHHNALPRAEALEQNGSVSGDYITTTNGVVRQTEDQDTEIDLGKYFNEQINTKPLLPYEGDYIIEGRYGNSIRFGGSVKDEALPETNKNDWSQGDEPIGTPITIIRNGQSSELDEKGWVPTIEDINRDDSSIYMTSNQKISSLIVASTNFQSYKAEIVSPTDPLTELIDPELNLIKAPELSEEEFIDQETETQQDLENTPSNFGFYQQEDALSPYDALLASGNFDDSDFSGESESTTETVTYSPEDDPALEPNSVANENSGDVDVNQYIGKYFRLKHFIASNTAQRKNINNVPGADGRIESQKVIDNLTALMENVGDKIYEKYPNMNITSGFRCFALNKAIGGSTTSEHSFGKAIDIQVSNVKTSEVYNWVVSNIPSWNQIIWEFPERESPSGGSGSWIHISYGGANQKKKTLASKKDSIHKSYGGNRRGNYQDGIQTANQSYV